jgi:uncharacterized protein (TIGR03437 family)
MRKLAASLCLFASAVFAQSADTIYFRTVMLGNNEAPAANSGATGVADILAHVVRDSSGQVITGTVDFLIHAKFPSDVSAIGLHIHSGAAGVAGPVVIGTPLSSTNPQAVKGGGDVVSLPAQVDGTNAAALAALKGLLQDPSQYYVNIHTPDFPGGAMRGQLVRAVGTMLMGQMSSDNEVPATGAFALGTAMAVAIGTKDANGAWVTGETYQTAQFSTEDRGTFVGFHIHYPGAVGTNGPVAIAAPLPSGTPIPDSGSGIIGPYYTEIDFTNTNQAAAFNNLFVNPGGSYMNAHTNQHGGGALRAQLRQTDTMAFPVLMSSANETTATKVTATAPAIITLHTIRNEDGSVAAGTVFFDVNYRLPGAATFTGLHIHDGLAGVAGPVTIPLIPSPVDAQFSSDTGFGNHYDYTVPANAAVLDDITRNPENHYVNIHTTVDGGGVARAQLQAAIFTAPAISAVAAGNGDKTATTVAPGGLIWVTGATLAKVAGDLSGWAGRTVPNSLNGAYVTVGGNRAAILSVSGTQILAQVPVDVAPGQQPVVVFNGNTTSNVMNVTVAATAPAIFNTPTAAVLKNSDYSLVSATNPAHAGDLILVFSTGLGTTTPMLSTGQIANGIFNTQQVSATIGGQNAPVVYSVRAPGYAGLDQTAITVPSGATGSSVPIVLTVGGVKSNAVNIPVQ